MNYEEIIKKAAEKRDLTKKLTEETQQKLVKEYIDKIKELKNRIKSMLKVEKLLIDNKFNYDAICTNCMSHKVGFVAGKNGIGIYAGGACGEWDLIVDEYGVPFMYGRGGRRNPYYSDISFLKRFVNEFNDFETRVQNFISEL